VSSTRLRARASALAGWSSISTCTASQRRMRRYFSSATVQAEKWQRHTWTGLSACGQLLRRLHSFTRSPSSVVTRTVGYQSNLPPAVTRIPTMAGGRR
jgi:hypothetical protein